ncbi:Protein T01C4.1, partial [Aphelenchoides avenae]
VEPCWEIVAVSYAFFTGVLKIESTVDVILAKFVLSFNVKVHDLVYPPLCDFGRFECEDYCIWQENNERAGAWTGTFKITVPALTDEATLFEEAFRPPSKCNPAWAHVGIRNERTCYKPTEAQVEVDCRGEGKLKQFTTQDLTRDGRTFHFKTDDQQKIECFVTIPGMPTPQKGDFNWVHFCLYGPDDYCGGRTGKGNYFFVVRNDGIYYGRNKGEENQALFSFPPCKDWNDVQQIVLSMEPTGKSQDPGLLCGKRIVGYYTGWGEGTISEFQLRRLTHVIFAFVEMSADGSLSFVQARQTETGYQRTKDAARFKYMRELARKVEAGVTIMVAMGGSDNSQYFSQICADATKRNQFVTNIANFLVNMKIDG